jgi:hypothetical protein
MMRYRFILVLAALLLLLPAGLSAQGRLEKVWFKNYEVKSVRPTGFRSLRATVELQMKNRGDQDLTIKDVRIVIYRNGQPYVEGTCPPFRVPVSYSSPEAVGSFRLCDGVSLWTVLRILLNINYAEFSADVGLTAVDEDGVEERFFHEGYAADKLIKHQK